MEQQYNEFKSKIKGLKYIYFNIPFRRVNRPNKMSRFYESIKWKNNVHSLLINNIYNTS